jgi:hypothetical protein
LENKKNYLLIMKSANEGRERREGVGGRGECEPGERKGGIRMILRGGNLRSWA